MHEMFPNGVGNNDVFCTPPSVYNQLDSIFNFTLDAACTRENCKAPKGFYFDEGIDALKIPWGKERVFCNPPFSLKAQFIEKAYNEVMFGETPIVVMLLPLPSQSTKAFQKYVKKNFIYETIEGRIVFIDPRPGKTNTSPSGTTVIYFKRDISR